jgi:hypothetical protein
METYKQFPSVWVRHFQLPTFITGKRLSKLSEFIREKEGKEERYYQRGCRIFNYGNGKAGSIE